MRISRGALACAIAASILAATPASPAIAAPPTAPYTVFSLAGSFNAVGTPANTTQLSLVMWGQEGFWLNMTYAGDSYSAGITAPPGQTLSTGTFATKRSADATHAGLDVSGKGSGCNETEGSMTIHELTRDAETNDITSIAVSYAQTTCLTTKGEIRWNSTVGYAVADSVSRSLGFGSQNVGDTTAAKTITLKSLGSQSVTFGAGSLAGANPSSFVITNNGCAGKTLAYDQTCTVSVAAKPQAFGELYASLDMVANTVTGKETVWLSAVGVKSNKGTFKPVTPSRILDTRSGNGAPKAPVGAAKSIDLQVRGRGGVPASGVSAVVLNVTVTSPTAHGHVTVWPTGVTQPVASSLNFTPGWTGANSVTVAVGAGGKVSLFNSAGTTHLIADVVGWYADATVTPEWEHGGLFHNITPHRRLDTRTWSYGKLGYGDIAWLFADFGDDAGNDANGHVKAWVVNVTATESSTPGFLTAWNGDEYNIPTASTLNLSPGKTVPNFAVVPSRRCWECTGDLYGASMIGIYSSGITHAIVDMFAVFDDGWDTSGLRLEPNTPTRIVDSRSGLGTAGVLGAGKTATITTPDQLAGTDTEALALNVTAVQPTVNTFMTVWPNGTTQPVVSNLNPHVGQIVPNAVVTGLDALNKFNVYNNAGSTHFVVDVVGRYWWYPYADAGMTAQASASVPAPAISLDSGRTEARLHRSR